MTSKPNLSETLGVLKVHSNFTRSRNQNHTPYHTFKFLSTSLASQTNVANCRCDRGTAHQDPSRSCCLHRCLSRHDRHRHAEETGTSLTTPHDVVIDVRLCWMKVRKRLHYSSNGCFGMKGLHLRRVWS